MNRHHAQIAARHYRAHNYASNMMQTNNLLNHQADIALIIFFSFILFIGALGALFLLGL